MVKIGNISIGIHIYILYIQLINAHPLVFCTVDGLQSQRLLFLLVLKMETDLSPYVRVSRESITE